jgi:hypothetical protein
MPVTWIVSLWIAIAGPSWYPGGGGELHPVVGEPTSS